ncbi:MAG: hypothetical protein JJU02_03910 [Cryomorphaceae bacterium]|nr:hypothetical protein [Cryomorphaceae bacterium]
MRIKTASAVICILSFIQIQGQSLFNLPAGNSHVENFDNIGSGLPVGWRVFENADSTNIGDTANFSGQHFNWNNLSGAFKNFAGAGGLSSGASSSQQSNHNNRALGLRQTNGFGDPGASINFHIQNTLGRENFQLSLDHLNLSPQNRSITYTVQYSVNLGNSWQSLGTYTTPPGATSADWGATNASYNFGSDADNLSTPLYIRIVALEPSSGTGNRDSYAIDDLVLTWDIMSNCTQPDAIDTAYTLAIDYNNIHLQWLSGGCADEYLIVATENPTLTASPTGNGSAYSADENFGQGTAIAPGEYVIHQGPANSTSIQNLQHNTTYTIGVFSRLGTDWNGPYILQTTTLQALSVFYTGNGNTGDWLDPDNWSANRVPAKLDTVVLDNTYINGNYQLELPSTTGTNEFGALYIFPNDSITLILPQSNQAAPGLSLNAADSALIIGDHATFINQSGASSGPGFTTNTWVIRGGGTYIHAVNRQTSPLISSLVKTRSDYPNANWVYGENFTTAPALVNQEYPSLEILGTPLPFFLSSTNPLIVYGNLTMGPNAEYDFNMRVELKGHGDIFGKARFTYDTLTALFINGDAPQELNVAQGGKLELLPGTKLSIENELTVFGEVSGDEVSLNNTNTLTLESDAVWTFWKGDYPGQIINYGNIVLPATDSAFATIMHETIQGSGLLTRNMYLHDFSGSGAQWFTIGVPVPARFEQLADSGAHFDLSSAQTSPLFFWDENSGTYDHPTSGADRFEIGRGYLLYAGSNNYGTFTRDLPGIISVSDTLTTAQDIPISLSHAVSNSGGNFTIEGEEDGWNLVANPFPTTYDWHNQNIPAAVEGSISIRNATNTGFITVGITETDSTRFLTPMQGFWIRTQSGFQNGNLMLSKNRRSDHNRNTLKRGQSNHLRFKFALTDSSGLSDPFIVGFHPAATEQFDAPLDGYKMPNDAVNPSWWNNHNAYAYALQYLPPLDKGRSLPMRSITPNEGAPYRIALQNDYENSNILIQIEDLFLDQMHDLRNGDYTFHATSADTVNRFIIHIGEPQITTEQFVPKNQVAKAWHAEGKLFLKGNCKSETRFTLYDLLGKAIGSWTTDNCDIQTIPTESLTSGVYLIQSGTHQAPKRILVY